MGSSGLGEVGVVRSCREAPERAQQWEPGWKLLGLLSGESQPGCPEGQGRADAGSVRGQAALTCAGARCLWGSLVVPYQVLESDLFPRGVDRRQAWQRLASQPFIQEVGERRLLLSASSVGG